MLYKLFYSLHEVYSPFNVFRYITFRAALATITAFVIKFILAPWVIGILKKANFTQHVREDGPKSHLNKTGTPTMGGLLIIISVVMSAAMWADMSNKYILIMMAAIVGFGFIGLADDYLKAIRRDAKGLRGWYKFGAQIILALAIGFLFYYDQTDQNFSMLSIPFFKRWMIDLGWFYIPFSILVIVGSSNAVNLTDGIDGLAIGLVAIACLANGALVYISGHAGFSKYLHVLFLPGTGELTVFCGAMFGASLGFLWFNSYPAEVFMGDVGSLGIGGALGTLAVITKHEIVLAVVGGIFVMETFSVIPGAVI